MCTDQSHGTLVVRLSQILLLLSFHTSQAVSLKYIMGQTISSSNFFFYGKRHFTQTGYKRHVKKFYTDPVQTSASIGIGQPGADGVDLTGKVVVVTGANSGLGKQVATYCAAKGAKLYMLCRSKDRAETAKAEIVEGTGNESVDVVLVDVGEMEQVREAAKTLQSKESKIDAIICNAGVLLNDRKESTDGYEATFASHLLGGTYLLSKLLMPQVEQADEGRVIIVTSGGMYNYALPDWDTVISKDSSAKFDGVSAYAYAKRGQVLLAERWAKEYPKVKFATVHPGWSDTNAVDEAFGSAKKYLYPLREPWEGAEGICWMVGTKASNLQSGELYLDRSVEPKHIAGPFYTERSHTKNTEAEVDEFMKRLQEVAGM